VGLKSCKVEGERVFFEGGGGKGGVAKKNIKEQERTFHRVDPSRGAAGFVKRKWVVVRQRPNVLKTNAEMQRS